MKWSMATVGVIILGLIGVMVILLFQHLTTSSESDYYLLKEITESAMFDAIDISYYRETGDVKIIREKFVENFTRRYSESTLFIGGRYIISFFDIMEMPPKVSLLVNTGIIDYQIYDESTRDSYDVLNSLSGIFEYSTKEKDDNKVYVEKEYTKLYYSMPDINSSNGSVTCVQPFYLPSEMSQREIRPGSVSIEFATRASNSLEDILMAKLRRGLDWVKAYSGGTDYYSTIDVNQYTPSCNVSNIYFYDCKNGVGTKHERMQCNQYNNFWIYWDATCNSGYEEVLLLIDMHFKYDEYEY